ncbi:MAG: efflux RND transporter periplasmic adaptor subunit [Acutalibacteraceae bacterium]
MEKKMSKKKIASLCILGVIILALLVGVIGYMLGWFDKGYDADVVTVQQRNVTSTFDTSGTVASSQEGVFNVVDGVTVKKVNVQVGSVVKKGDLLAEFDADSLNSTLQEKKAALDKAQKAYNDYKSSSATAKLQLSSLDKQIAAAEKTVAQLEKKSKDEQTAAKLTEQEKQQAQQAQDNLSSITNDSTLAGKIIDNIVNSSESLQSIKKMLDAISSMNSGSLSDMTQLMSGMSSSSSQYELMQAQLELAGLKMSKMTAQAQADGNLESVYKSVYEAALSGYNETKEVIDSLNAGWRAQEDGVVSEVNIKQGEKVEIKKDSSSVSSFDISSIVSAVTSGGDVSKLVSSFFSSDSAGIKVQYYPLQIKFMINKADLSKISVGKKVMVESETGAELEGEVTFVAAVASASSGVDINSLLGTSGGSTGGIETVVTVDNPDSGLIIGLDADVSVETEEKSGCITVPVESIVYDDKHAYVFVYDPNEKIITKTIVETGILDGTYYEILSGVSTGDIIIRTPVATMQDGDRVIAHNVDNK